MTTNEFVTYAIIAVEDKRGVEISVIDVSKVSVVAGYLMLISGTNQKQTQATADKIGEEFAKREVFPCQKGGYPSGIRILLDYQNAVICIFNGEDRCFHDLERIWADGITVNPKTFHVSEE